MRWFVAAPDEPRIGTRAAVWDCLFLTAVVTLSCVPYIRGLGLYSDDWAILSELHNARDSIRHMWAALVSMGIATRPVQGLVLAGLYMLFELEPVGYHIVNTAVLAAAALLFYLSLRALHVTRLVAVAVPLVFALLPHYSTDRFWIAAFQANVSVFLYFLSLYADLRFVFGTSARRWLWKMLGMVALVGSVLAYEVTGPLFLINVLVLLHAARVRQHGRWHKQSLPTALVVATNVLVLALAVGFKMTTTMRADASGGYRYRVLRIIQEAAPVHFGEYGVALPVKVGRALRDYPDAAGLVVSLLIGVIVCAYVLRVVRPQIDTFDRRIHWPAVVLAGGVLFAAGYGVSLLTWEIAFHATGTNNRTAIGAAIGVAWVFVGAIGWVSSRMPSDRSRWLAYAGVLGLLALGNTVLVNAIAGFWLSASQQQREVIASIRQQFPELSPGTTLLLDGLCPFDGPAVVFATNWDVRGMLQLQYDERSLQGDVVKPNTEVTPAGIRTILFDDWINVYPYSDSLMVYHLRTGGVYPLASMDAAREYFDNVSTPARPPCPPYTDGDGAPIL